MGVKKPVQVIQGLCRKSSGNGYKASVASTIPSAKTLTKNISDHPAGWLSGFLQQKGWKKDCISKLLKGSFTPESVVAAQNDTWDKKTGTVASSQIAEDELHLRELQNLWVDMNLGALPSDVPDLDATLNAGGLMAYNFEDGCSTKTLNSDDKSTINSVGDHSLSDLELSAER